MPGVATIDIIDRWNTSCFSGYVNIIRAWREGGNRIGHHSLSQHMLIDRLLTPFHRVFTGRQPFKKARFFMSGDTMISCKK